MRHNVRNASANIKSINYSEIYYLRIFFMIKCYKMLKNLLKWKFIENIWNIFNVWRHNRGESDTNVTIYDKYGVRDSKAEAFLVLKTFHFILWIPIQIGASAYFPIPNRLSVRITFDFIIWLTFQIQPARKHLNLTIHYFPQKEIISIWSDTLRNELVTFSTS